MAEVTKPTEYTVSNEWRVRSPVYHDDKDSFYSLPNDTPEQRRLAAQASFLSTLLKSHTLHAPVSQESLGYALDVGCGTGIVTELLGKSFPATECYGLDLSSIQGGRSYPENVRFLRGNVMSGQPTQWIDSAGQTPINRDEDVFGYIFSRLLVLGITDWPGYVKRLFTLLKPGGWVEVQEIDSGDYFDVADNRISDNWAWARTLTHHCQNEGFDFRCGTHAAERMRDAGFQDVQSFTYRWPYGSKAEHQSEEDRAFARFNDASFPELLHHVLQRTFEAIKSQEEINGMQEEMRKSFSPDVRMWKPFIVTIGRKPI